MVYGSNENEDASVPFSEEFIQTSIIHPNTTSEVKMIILADWNQIHEKIAEFKSINETFDTILQSESPNGIMINGDIAYDLDSNNGTNYEEFLTLLSRFARYVPVFLNTGNH